MDDKDKDRETKPVITSLDDSTESTPSIIPNKNKPVNNYPTELTPSQAIRILSTGRTPELREQLKLMKFPNNPTRDGSNLLEFLSRGRTLPTEIVSILTRLIEAKDELLFQYINKFRDDKEMYLSDFEDEIYDRCCVEIEKSYNSLFEIHTTDMGKELSILEKTARKMSGMALVYGEINFRSLVKVICKNFSMPHAPAKFIDIGSGTGKAVFGAAFIHKNWSKCWGVEILESLVDVSQEVLERYNTHFSVNNNENKNINEDNDNKNNNETKFEFICDDFRNVDFSDTDIMFVNCTCFDAQLMRDLSVLAQRMKLGSMVITLTNKLNSSHFRVISSECYDASWGLCTINAQIKVREPKLTPIVPKVIPIIEYVLDGVKLAVNGLETRDQQEAKESGSTSNDIATLKPHE